MSRHSPGWKAWFFLALSVPLGVLFSVGASVRIADHNTQEAIRRARAAGAAQKAATCTLVAHILAAYEETPPPSTAGRNVAEAWREEYRTIGCTPVR